MKRTYRNVLKGMKEIKTFMTPGNHDSYPQDSFKGHEPKQNHVLNKIPSEWAPFFTTGE